MTADHLMHKDVFFSFFSISKQVVKAYNRWNFEVGTKRIRGKEQLGGSRIQRQELNFNLSHTHSLAHTLALSLDLAGMGPRIHRLPGGLPRSKKVDFFLAPPHCHTPLDAHTPLVWLHSCQLQKIGRGCNFVK